MLQGNLQFPFFVFLVSLENIPFIGKISFASENYIKATYLIIKTIEYFSINEKLLLFTNRLNDFDWKSILSLVDWFMSGKTRYWRIRKNIK